MNGHRELAEKFLEAGCNGPIEVRDRQLLRAIIHLLMSIDDELKATVHTHEPSPVYKGPLKDETPVQTAERLAGGT